jgi:hypothetical protein
MDNFNLKSFLSEGKLLKESTEEVEDVYSDEAEYYGEEEGKANPISMREEDESSPSQDIQKAYEEAYKNETGESINIDSFTFGDVEIKETIVIKDVVSNGEELGDVTLINTGEGYNLAY